MADESRLVVVNLTIISSKSKVDFKKMSFAEIDAVKGLSSLNLKMLCKKKRNEVLNLLKNRFSKTLTHFSSVGKVTPSLKVNSFLVKNFCFRPTTVLIGL